MKVYFAPNGMALGHAGRCLPIAKRLRELGAQILFSTYGDAVEFISALRLPVVKVPEIKLVEGRDGTIEMLQTSIRWPKYLLTFIKQLVCEIRNIKGFKPDVVVSDSRLSPILASILLGVPCVLLLHQIKLLIPHKKPLGKVKMKIKSFGEHIILCILWLMWSRSTSMLVPDFPFPYTVAKEHLKIPVKFLRRVKFVGQIIDKLPHELPSKEEAKRMLGFDERPLIYVGISGTRIERDSLNALLLDIISRLPEKYQVIMSMGYPGEVKEVFRKDGVRVYNWIPDRYLVLKACDVVVSRSGHNTIAESMYYGVPSILIPTPAHTEHEMNARSAEAMGIAKVIRQKDLNRETLLKAISDILEDGSYRERAARIQKEILKNNSVDLVVREIISLSNAREGTS
ncbi:MAG: glycosyltransferase [Candidatus Jordarchaeales archaeon]